MRPVLPALFLMATLAACAPSGRERLRRSLPAPDAIIPAPLALPPISTGADPVVVAAEQRAVAAGNAARLVAARRNYAALRATMAERERAE